MINTNADLFAPPPITPAVTPWRPKVCDSDNWPPDYQGVYAWRIATLVKLRAQPAALASAEAYYSTRPAEFIQDWMDTYNPRKTEMKWMPFIFFPRQYECIQYFEDLRRDGESGLVEKCRDIGATWLACAYSVWCLRFLGDDSTGWGSRKEDLVDKLGDPDSIFEKIRLLIDRLPDIWRPDCKRAFKKIINVNNGASVTGEAGDGIGRGGRKSRFFVDEAQPLTAHILTPFGWQTMGEMSVGSLIVDPQGGWQQVTHINDCGEHETYRVTFTDGTSTECSKNHKWPVRNRRTGAESIKSVAELLPIYRYQSPGGTTQYHYAIPTTHPVDFIGRGSFPLDPYLVGALIGDGSVGTVPKNCAKITSVDDEVIQQFRELLPEGCDIRNSAGSIDWRIVDVRGRTGTRVKSRARQAIVAAGIAGMRAHEKSVPDMYKFGALADRLALLQGLLDTDGSAAKSGAVSYYTCSHELALDVQFIVQSLGGTAIMSKRCDARGYRDQYVLHIAMSNGIQLFRLKHKLERTKNRINCKNRYIAKIVPIGVQIVRCITVDGDSSTYLTDNCIVTHNSAHIERPEGIEASLGDNTNVRIDMSSVNGLGNVFHRRREAGVLWTPGATIAAGQIRVFIFDWSDHPEKTQEWYDQRKARSEREGMQHVFAQEVDRNYSAAVQNTVIDSAWIDAAVDAHLQIPCLMVEPFDTWMAGLDVADGGMDRNALALRQWVILRHVEEWGERDAGVTTRRMLSTLRLMQRSGFKVQYDSIGIGATVKAEYNRLLEEGHVTYSEYDLVPWNAGAKVVEPFARVVPGDDQSSLNRDFFQNMKAQAWWALRTRFYKTWRARTQGAVYLPDELISIDGTIPLLHQLKKELAQPTRGQSASTLKMLINKAPEGTRSPNLADAVVQAFFPAPDYDNSAEIGSMSG